MFELPRILPTANCTDCHCRSMRMFCDFSPAALRDFDAIGTTVLMPKGAVLFREDDAADRIFAICAGQVKLSCGSSDGKTLNLKIALAGDVLGLSAVVSGSRLEVTAETLAATHVKVVRSTDFLAFLESHAEAGLRVARTLSKEYRSAFADARRLALSGSVAGRLAALLLEWGQATCEGKPQMRYSLALTHDELANFTGSSRESITRALGMFQREKLVEIKGITVHIMAPERLAAFSEA